MCPRLHPPTITTRLHRKDQKAHSHTPQEKPTTSGFRSLFGPSKQAVDPNVSRFLCEYAQNSAFNSYIFGPLASCIDRQLVSSSPRPKDHNRHRCRPEFRAVSRRPMHHDTLHGQGLRREAMRTTNRSFYRIYRPRARIGKIWPMLLSQHVLIKLRLRFRTSSMLMVLVVPNLQNVICFSCWMYDGPPCELCSILYAEQKVLRVTARTLICICKYKDGKRCIVSSVSSSILNILY